MMIIIAGVSLAVAVLGLLSSSKHKAQSKIHADRADELKRQMVAATAAIAEGAEAATTEAVEKVAATMDAEAVRESASETAELENDLDAQIMEIVNETGIGD